MLENSHMCNKKRRAKIFVLIVIDGSYADLFIAVKNMKGMINCKMILCEKNH